MSANGLETVQEAFGNWWAEHGKWFAFGVSKDLAYSLFRAGWYMRESPNVELLSACLKWKFAVGRYRDGIDNIDQELYDAIPSEEEDAYDEGGEDTPIDEV